MKRPSAILNTVKKWIKRMLRIGIIGCGKIADTHAEQIQRIPDCKIVGVCDQEELMARQFCERYDAEKYFSEARELLQVSQPDVIHVTTPPQSHFEIGKLCLEAGCHAYIEKPFTLNTEEAEILIKCATEKNLKITVGHDAQFSQVALRMRELIKTGFLGGAPSHMESIYCYDFGDIRYAKALFGDKTHWIRALPGKLLQNVISHGICKIAEFLAGDNPQVLAHGFSSPLIKGINEGGIIDELRVIIHDNRNTSAYFTFSSQINPVLNQFRVYGPKNSLIVDENEQTLIKIKGGKYKSYLNYFIPPYIYAKQYLGNSMNNIRQFIKMDLHMNSGMRNLISAFYDSVANNSPLPVPYREIILTSRIMDSIFDQLNFVRNT